jgi:hypothetical protein
LERAIFEVVNENLLSMDLSYLMPDLKRVYENLGLQLEETVRAYLEAQSAA